MICKEANCETFNGRTSSTQSGGYDNTGDGSRIAKDRLDQLRLDSQTVEGGGAVARLVAGAVFRLKQHVRADFNRDWLILNLHHDATQPQVLEEEAPDNEGTTYSNSFELMPAEQGFRPQQTAVKPRMIGIQTAVVVGPPGEQIYTDEHGRIQVRFHWDREGKNSCWLRLSQAWASNQWGSVVLPRVGQEVVVSFVNDDPDQPIVTGCLYHGLHKTPYPLPEHKSRSVLRSQSLAGKDGHELMLEDRAGQERIAIHSSRDFELHVTQDARASVDRHTHSHIAGDALTQIQGAQHQTIQGERRSKIDGQDSLEVGQSLHIKAGTGIFKQAGREIHLKAGTSVSISGGMELSLKGGGSSISLNPAGVFLNGPMINLNSGGGGGSAAAASPKAPELPFKLGDKKAGQATAKALETTPPPVDELEFVQLSKTATVHSISVAALGSAIPVNPQPLPSGPTGKSPAIPKQFPPELFGKSANDDQFKTDKLGGFARQLGPRLLGLVGLLGYSSELGSTVRWTDENDVEYVKHGDELYFTATHPDGHVDQFLMDKDGTLWQEGKVVATTDESLSTHPVSPLDDVAYRVWLANGGDGAFQEWVALGKPDKKNISKSRTANLNMNREERLKELAEDPAHSGAISPKTLQEAEVGLSLEEAGILSGPIKRDPRPDGGEFIDANEQVWDVKAFDSRWPPRKGGFKLERDIARIEHEIAQDENVIIDTSNLSMDDYLALRTAIEEKGIASKIRWWPPSLNHSHQ